MGCIEGEKILWEVPILNGVGKFAGTVTHIFDQILYCEKVVAQLKYQQRICQHYHLLKSEFIIRIHCSYVPYIMYK